MDYVDRAAAGARWCKLLSFLIACGTTGEPLPAGTRGDRLLVEKVAHRMTLYRGDSALKTYAVALGRGGIEDKQREGDNLVPEGVFRIDGRIAQSRYHRALHVSYPDAAHLNRARALGVPAGGDIMVHGIKNGFGWLGALHRTVDWTRGCVALTDDEIDELWRAVPDGARIEIKR